MKLADRLSNIQRLDTHPRPEKRRDYYNEIPGTACGRTGESTG
jgi:(p)ppGpp synthase/HD superfamily hydrolase